MDVCKRQLHNIDVVVLLTPDGQLDTVSSLHNRTNLNNMSETNEFLPARMSVGL